MEGLSYDSPLISNEGRISGSILEREDSREVMAGQANDSNAQDNTLTTSLLAHKTYCHPNDPSSTFSYNYSRSSATRTWNSFTAKNTKLILSLFPILLFAGFYCMPLFTQYTDSTFHPVPRSLSEEAVEVCKIIYTQFVVHFSNNHATLLLNYIQQTLHNISSTDL